MWKLHHWRLQSVAIMAKRPLHGEISSVVILTLLRRLNVVSRIAIPGTVTNRNNKNRRLGAFPESRQLIFSVNRDENWQETRSFSVTKSICLHETCADDHIPQCAECREPARRHHYFHYQYYQRAARRERPAKGAVRAQQTPWRTTEQWRVQILYQSQNSFRLMQWDTVA